MDVWARCLASTSRALLRSEGLQSSTAALGALPAGREPPAGSLPWHLGRAAPCSRRQASSGSDSTGRVTTARLSQRVAAQTDSTVERDAAAEFTRKVLGALERRFPTPNAGPRGGKDRAPRGPSGAGAAGEGQWQAVGEESNALLEQHVADGWAAFEERGGEEGAEAGPGPQLSGGAEAAAGVRGAESPGEGEKKGKKKKKGQRSRGGGSEQLDPAALKALPKVAIVGRPNVGKSALFNRLTGQGLAIVYDYPGVTRDRLYVRGEWAGRDFVVVDTGGLLGSKLKAAAALTPTSHGGPLAPGLPEAVEQAAAAGVEEADSLILVVDGQAGLTAADEEIAQWLRRKHPTKPVLLAVNKCENLHLADAQANEFWRLGWEPLPVSAISGSGSGDVLDALTATLPAPGGEQAPEGDAEDAEAPLGVAIVGRPNVGKSSLLNALLGEERAIVSPMAGTTRDSVDSFLTGPAGQRFRLVDTAGIRRRTAVRDSPDRAEGLSVSRAMRAVRRADVALLVVDAEACTRDGRFEVPAQDFRLAEMIAEAGRACVVVVNKWDAVPDKQTNTLAEYQAHLLACLRPVKWAGVVFSSATTGQRVPKILEAAWEAGQQHQRRIGTSALNLVLKEATNWRAPPTGKGTSKVGRIYFITQADVKPPTFVCFVNDEKLFGDDYRKYVETQLRENVGFPGTPLRLYWRGKPKRDRRKAPGLRPTARPAALGGPSGGADEPVGPGQRARSEEEWEEWEGQAASDNGRDTLWK